MSQVWYVGPIALAAGGEPYAWTWVGVWYVPIFTHLIIQTAALAGVTCRPLRYLDLKYFGR
jgi:hypothetical protein